MGTTNVGGPFQVGVVDALDAPTKSVVVKVSAMDPVVIGATLVVSTDEAYVARIRVFKIAKDLATGELEHLEPGVAIKPGQLVWSRVDTK